ncbi:MAG: sugar-binding domain-containing protein [Ferruginibacter sp.]
MIHIFSKYLAKPKLFMGTALLLLLLCISIQSMAQETRQTILFNDGWKFYKGAIEDGDKPGLNDATWRAVDLPHDWSIEGPFDEQWASATAYLPGGIGWYRKTFEIVPTLRSKNIFIYFDGVYKNSEVWINGHYLGKRPNGFISFQYEITKFINKTGKNVVAVKVDHTEFADSRWYTGSGIYRNVYLVATERVHVDVWGIKFSTPNVSPAKAVARVSVSLINQSLTNAVVVVKSNLIDNRGKTIAATSQQLQINADHKGDANLSFLLNAPKLWSTANPQLYKLEVAVFVKGKKVDDISQKVGIRWFSFDKDKGFFLNGNNLKLKGVCLHDDAGGLGVAVPEEVWIRRLVKLKEAGCNSIRMSHNPHADYLYNLCDSMGFLVMDEAFDEWESGKNKWIKGWNVGKPGKDGYHTYFEEWAARDTKDMVLRNINHPSIIMWSIGNEIDYPNDPYTHEILNTGRNPQIYGKGFVPGYPAAGRLGELAGQLIATVKLYDTTRPVTAALAGVVMSNETTYPRQLDIVGYNYQEYRYQEDHKKYPDRIIYGSENGMQISAWDAVEQNDYIAGQYLWTGIDYLGEARSWPSKSNAAGLLDLAGFPKSEFYFRQSLWTDQPMIYVGTAAIKTTNSGDRRNLLSSWNYSAGDSVRITCFTNCDEAALFINGRSLGRQSLTGSKEKRIIWNTLYEPGQATVKGYKNGSEINHQTITTAGEAYSVKAIPDRSYLIKNASQLVHVEITITDANGNRINGAENEITVTVDGPAKLLALENGNSISHEDYKANKRKLYNGKLMAYIQTKKNKDAVKITISSEGLKSQAIDFPVQ